MARHQKNAKRTLELQAELIQSSLPTINTLPSRSHSLNRNESTHNVSRDAPHPCWRLANGPVSVSPLWSVHRSLLSKHPSSPSSSSFLPFPLLSFFAATLPPLLSCTTHLPMLLRFFLTLSLPVLLRLEVYPKEERRLKTTRTK